MDIATVLLSLGATAISGSGIAAITSARIARRRAPVDIAATLSEAAMKQVDQLQERVQEAEVAAKAARDEADEARDKLRMVNLSLDRMTIRVNQIALWIHDPNTTLEWLRSRIPPPNGASAE